MNENINRMQESYPRLLGIRARVTGTAIMAAFFSLIAHSQRLSGVEIELQEGFQRIPIPVSHSGGNRLSEILPNPPNGTWVRGIGDDGDASQFLGDLWTHDRDIPCGTLIEVFVPFDTSLFFVGQQCVEPSSFVIGSEVSVPNRVYNVLNPGVLTVVADWESGPSNATLSLFGPTSVSDQGGFRPVASTSGPAPLVLQFNIADDMIDQGVQWQVTYELEGDSSELFGLINTFIPKGPSRNQHLAGELVGLKTGQHLSNGSATARFKSRLNQSNRLGHHGIIRFNRPLDCVESDYLEHIGISLQSFLSPNSAFGLVSKNVDFGDPFLVDALEAVSSLNPSEKVNRDLLVKNYSEFIVGGSPRSFNRALRGDGALLLTVKFADDLSTNDMLTLIGRFSGEVPSRLAHHQWLVVAQPQDLSRIASLDEVEWVDAGPAPGRPDNDRTRNLTGVNNLQAAVVTAGPPAMIAFAGLSGANVTVGVQDSGIESQHGDLEVVGTAEPPLIPTGWFVDRDHGTNVAGIIGSSGALSVAEGAPNQFQWRGMAPGVALIDSQWLDWSGVLFDAITQHGVDLVNRSQSFSYDGSYDAQNERIDGFIRGGATAPLGETIPRKPQIFSAGNRGQFPQHQEPGLPGIFAGDRTTAAGQSGYFSISKEVKNALVVGNAININRLAPSSSMGPTYDGRIKPDLIAPGSNITTTDNTGSYTDASPFSGTSAATPAVAGIAALLLEQWNDTYNQTIGVELDENPPLPSTLRAILIHTARDVVNNDVRNVASPEIDSDSDSANGNDGNGRARATEGPDFATGWGFVDADAASLLLGENRRESGRAFPTRLIQSALCQAQTTEYEFIVDSLPEIKVTLCWDDVPASSWTARGESLLVNDLDLELVDPDGNIFYPWQLGHRILDAAGNELTPAQQPPGTEIVIHRDILPVDAPSHEYEWDGSEWIAIGPDEGEAIPQSAFDLLAADNHWVAKMGRDHLNNVEQVLVKNPKSGRWTARVVGFRISDGPQDYSLVGFPYPNLPDLKVVSHDKVGINQYGTPMEFRWTASNTGSAPTPTGFDYQVYLSSDFEVDSNDILLTDSNQWSLPALKPGQSFSRTSKVTINATDAGKLLQNGNPRPSIQELTRSDPFILVRVDSNDQILEHLEDNTAFTQLARLTDVELVVDRSGSMDRTIPVSQGSRRKIDILLDAAEVFLDAFRVDTGDSLGVVSFADSASTDLIRQAYTSVPNANRSAMRALNGVLPGGQTDIRAGLETALNSVASGDPEHRRVIILFSDGRHTTGLSPRDSTFLDRFRQNDSRVFSVGFGTPGDTSITGIDIPMLQLLSNADGGRQGFFQVTDNVARLKKFFVDAVAGAIDLQTPVDPIGFLRPGERVTVPFDLTQEDDSLALYAMWGNPRAQLEVSLRTPTGLLIDAARARKFSDNINILTRPGHSIMTVSRPLAHGSSIEDHGNWEMIVSNTSRASASYSASVTVDSTLKAHAVINGNLPIIPGDPIPIDMSATQLGGAVLRRGRASVVANVPAVSLADLAAAARITPADLHAVTSMENGETVSPDERLYRAIIAKANLPQGTELLARNDLPPIQLSEELSGGVYSGTVPGIDGDGYYQFTLRINGVTPDCEPYQREIVRYASVPARASAAASVVRVDHSSTSERDSSSGPTLTVIPRTASGRNIGPGIGPRLRLSADQVEPLMFNDNMDGSYSIPLGLGGSSFEQADLLSVLLDEVELGQFVLNPEFPRIDAISPSGGINSTENTLRIQLSDTGIITTMPTEVALVTSDGRVGTSLPLSSESPREFTAVIPVGIQPGMYRLSFSDGAWSGAIEPEASYTVIDSSGRISRDLDELSEFIGAAPVAGISGNQITDLGRIFQVLGRVSEHYHIPFQSLETAFEALARIGAGLDTISVARIPLSRIVTEATESALIQLTNVAVTSSGRQISSQLSPQVRVNFGRVIGRGVTDLETQVFQDEIPDYDLQGHPVVYRIKTTARFDRHASNRISIHRPLPLRSAGEAVILQRIQGSYRDITLPSESDGDVLVGEFESLGEFVIAVPVRARGDSGLFFEARADRTEMTVRWERDGVLESRASFEGEEWEPVSLDRSANEYVITIPSSGNRFYRLRRP